MELGRCAWMRYKYYSSHPLTNPPSGSDETKGEYIYLFGRMDKYQSLARAGESDDAMGHGGRGITGRKV